LSKFRTTMYFDMRAPDFGAPARELHGAALEMSAFAEAIGIDHIGLMEHHGTDDGYLANPFVMGAAVAARTNTIRISLGAVVLPLHDPLKVAEDIALLDNISGGRIEVIFGAGYVPYEFDRFRTSLRDRAKLMDAGIEIILRALQGERYVEDGREIFVRPLPVQDPRDILLVGGGVKAAAERAAKFDLGFAPINPKLFALYLERMAEYGHAPRKMHSPARPLAVHLAEDVDEGWAVLMPHAFHAANAYAAWSGTEGTKGSSFNEMNSEEAVRTGGVFRVMTPNELLEFAGALPAGRAIGFQPLLGGLPPAEAWKSLKLLEGIMPELRRLQED
jgi:alkanesulfonate monooxygenase SsuD/methylene tetrahydromethanopterin reductase-like flavin-dependent oxidoreductase (luciferase family)